jgi:histidinol-phosphatase (PHP family)
MVWFSYHGGHSGEFCGHAKGQLAAVVSAAVAAGFSTYGLSEHAPRYRREHLYPEEQNLTPDDLVALFRRYVQTALALRERHENEIELLIGFETEALPVDGWADTMRQLRRSAPFDYIVGSVHSIGDTWIDLNAETSERAAQACGGWEPLRCTYFDRWAELVEALSPEVVGHVDLIRRFEAHDFRFSPGALRHAERVLEAARAEGAALEVNAPYTDVGALRTFAAGCDVVTYEFENIPAEPLRDIEPLVPLFPHWRVLEICQNRTREKNWLRANGFPHVPFAEVPAGGDLAAAVRTIGLPCVVKTADFRHGDGSEAYQGELDDSVRQLTPGAKFFKTSSRPPRSPKARARPTRYQQIEHVPIRLARARESTRTSSGGRVDDAAVPGGHDLRHRTGSLVELRREVARVDQLHRR